MPSSVSPLQPQALTSCSCVVSSPLFFPFPFSQAVRSLTVHLSRWHSNLVAGGPDFWVRPAWLFVCNTFTPSLSLFFCCFGSDCHAVHFHLSLLYFIYSVAWLTITLRSLGPCVNYRKRYRDSSGFYRFQNNSQVELPLLDLFYVSISINTAIYNHAQCCLIARTLGVVVSMIPILWREKQR